MTLTLLRINLIIGNAVCKSCIAFFVISKYGLVRSGNLSRKRLVTGGEIHDQNSFLSHNVWNTHMAGKDVQRIGNLEVRCSCSVGWEKIQ